MVRAVGRDETPRMVDPMPFCGDCGVVGVALTGVHPGADHLVRWTIYRCGHAKTEIVLDEADVASLQPSS
jgi:hypothetical protein